MIPSSVLDAIQAKIDHGDEFLNTDDFTRAVEQYRQALAMIPEPKARHAISLPAFTALGEGYFFAGHFGEAIAAFRAALQAPGGIENPLAYLRLGQAYFDHGELDRAADALTRAYALDGTAIFDDEDEKYLAFLATRIEL